MAVTPASPTPPAPPTPYGPRPVRCRQRAASLPPAATPSGHRVRRGASGPSAHVDPPRSHGSADERLRIRSTERGLGLSGQSSEIAPLRGTRCSLPRSTAGPYTSAAASDQIVTVHDERKVLLPEEVSGQSCGRIRDDLVDETTRFDHCYALVQGHDGPALVGSSGLIGQDSDDEVVTQRPCRPEQGYVPGMEEVTDHVDIDAGRHRHARPRWRWSRDQDMSARVPQLHGSADERPSGPCGTASTSRVQIATSSGTPSQCST